MSQRLLAPNVASVTSVANDKGDNKMILGAVHRSSSICLTAKENPSFRPNEVGRIAQHIRKGEGRKLGKDGVGIFFDSSGNSPRPLQFLMLQCH